MQYAYPIRQRWLGYSGRRGVFDTSRDTSCTALRPQLTRGLFELRPQLAHGPVDLLEPGYWLLLPTLSSPREVTLPGQHRWQQGFDLFKGAIENAVIG